MDALSNILESELNEAVEVKNPESLHRYVSLMTHSFIMKENNDREHSEFREAMARSDARWEELIKRMDVKFDAVDKRFEAIDKRFEAVDKRFDETIREMDTRFSAVDKRFDDLHKQFNVSHRLTTVGFIVLATLMSLYQFLA